MFIRQLIWEQDNANDNLLRHSIDNPSWNDIQAAFSRLEGQTYPAFFLTCDEQNTLLPSLSVIGGPHEYEISLERVPAHGRGEFERLQLIHPPRFYNPDVQGWRGIGKSYHNYEIGTKYLTPDRELALEVIEHFTYTGQWLPKAPFIVQAEDEEGEWREYTD
jgi:hypothetical protein